MTPVFLEVWPVVRPPGVTEGRGAPGWRYTLRADGADVVNFTPVTGPAEPALWLLNLPVGTTARVDLTQIPRQGYRLDRVGCSVTTGSSMVDRDVAVRLRGDTASFEIGGVDPTYLCNFHNIPLGIPATDSAPSIPQAGSTETSNVLLVLAAIFTCAFVLVTHKLRHVAG
jgi:hypothetical protein